MDPNLWSALPEELRDKVFINLPFHSFFRLRVVCKRWNALAGDDAFLEGNAGPELPRPCFALSGEENDPKAQFLFVHDAASRAFDRLPLPAACFTHASGHNTRRAEHLLYCYTNIALSVFNLRTKLCTTTKPPWPALGLVGFFKGAFRGLVADRATGAYKFIALGETRPLHSRVRHCLTLIYDSRSRAWQAAITARTGPPPAAGVEGVCNGVFLVNYDNGMSVFDCQTESWQFVPSQHHHRWCWIFRRCCLGGWNEDVYTAGEATIDGVEFIGVWRLEKPWQKWTEVDRMPETMYQWLMEDAVYDFVSRRGTRGTEMRTTMSREYVLFCSYEIMNAQKYSVVLYNLATKEWIF